MAVIPNPKMVNPNHAGVIWDPDCKLLLHCDQASPEAGLVDSSMYKRMISYNKTQSMYDTVNKKFGISSFDFGNSGGAVMPVDHDLAVLQFHSPLSVDFWAKLRTAPITPGEVHTAFCCYSYSGTSLYKWIVSLIVGNPVTSIALRIEVANNTLTSSYVSFPDPTGDFHHYAAARDSDGRYLLFIDGALVKAETKTLQNTYLKDSYKDGAAISIGSSWNGGLHNYIKACVDEFRIMSRCDYKEQDFVPPSAPYSPYLY